MPTCILLATVVNSRTAPAVRPLHSSKHVQKQSKAQGADLPPCQCTTCCQHQRSPACRTYMMPLTVTFWAKTQARRVKHEQIKGSAAIHLYVAFSIHYNRSHHPQPADLLLQSAYRAGMRISKRTLNMTMLLPNTQGLCNELPVHSHTLESRGWQ